MYTVSLSANEIEVLTGALETQLRTSQGLGHHCIAIAGHTPHYQMAVINHNRLMKKLNKAKE